MGVTGLHSDFDDVSSGFAAAMTAGWILCGIAPDLADVGTIT